MNPLPDVLRSMRHTEIYDGHGQKMKIEVNRTERKHNALFIWVTYGIEIV